MQIATLTELDISAITYYSAANRNIWRESHLKELLGRC